MQSHAPTLPGTDCSSCKAATALLVDATGAQNEEATLVWRAQNVPPFTHEAQRWIWDRQNPHPSNCSRQKYYLGDNIKKQVRCCVDSCPALDPNSGLCPT